MLPGGAVINVILEKHTATREHCGFSVDPVHQPGLVGAAAIDPMGHRQCFLLTQPLSRHCRSNAMKSQRHESEGSAWGETWLRLLMTRCGSDGQ